LYLSENSIIDISALANLTKLTYLYFHNNSIIDISALANLTTLTKLYLNDNSIIDISALATTFAGTAIVELNISTNSALEDTEGVGCGQAAFVAAVGNGTGTITCDNHVFSAAQASTLSGKGYTVVGNGSYST